MSSVAVTAADRAAATCQRWVPHSLRGDRAKVSKGRSQSPLVVPERHETLTCGGYAATPSLLPQKGGPSAQRMVEDILFPPQLCVSQQKGLSSVSLTADCSLCGGSLLAPFPAKPPLKGEVPAIGGRRGSFSQRRQVTMLIETRPLSGGTTYAEVPKSNASRSSGERGLGGEGLLSEKPPLPPACPHPPVSSGREREGGELLYREAPLPRIPLQYICPRKRVSVMEVGGALAKIAAA